MVTARHGRSVSAANVAHVLERRLSPLSLVQRDEPEEYPAAVVPPASQLLARADVAASVATPARVSGSTGRARITLSTWLLVVGPVLAVNLVLLLVFTPSLVATAVRACVDAVRVALDAFGAGEVVTGIAATGSLAVLALPAVAVPVLLVRLGLRGWRAAQETCHGRPLVTAGFTLTAATVAAALTTCWVWRGI